MGSEMCIRDSNYHSLGAMIGAEVRIVGFGRTETDDRASSGVKRFGYSRLERVTEIATLGRVAITGAPEFGGARLCLGDSGGPMFITVGGVEFLAGVNSAVARFNSSGPSSGQVRCEDEDARNAEVRVDNYQDWINGAIKELEGGSFFLTSGCNTTSGATGCLPLFLLFVFALGRRRKRLC